jgi:hypothetical protein
MNTVSKEVFTHGHQVYLSNDLTEAQTNDLPHSRRARLPLHHRYGYILNWFIIIC